MTRLDTRWMDDHQWWYRDENLVPHIKDNAPQEVRESFENYKRQIKSESV